MWQLPVVEHPSRVSALTEGWCSGVRGCRSLEGHSGGDSALRLPSPHRADDGTGIQLSARTTTPPKSSLRSQKGVFYWVCFLGLGGGFFNSLWDGLAAPGTSLAAHIGNAGKGKMFSFLKLNFLKPMERKIEKYQTRGGGRTRELCACSGRSCGAQVGRQPMAQRWDGWRAGDGELPHKASGARARSGWPWKPFRNPSAQLPKPYSITGAWQRVAGVTGGVAAGGRPRVPGQRGLTSPSARLGPAEEKPQSSRGIFSVNRVFLGIGFKTAQLLSRVLIRKS